MRVVPPSNTWPLNWGRVCPPPHNFGGHSINILTDNELIGCWHLGIRPFDRVQSSAPAFLVNLRINLAESEAARQQRAIDGAVDGAMIGRMAGMLCNYFMMPLGASPEELARLLEQMGIDAPHNVLDIGMSSGTLLAEAKTLRQRCFARLFNGFDKKTGVIYMSYIERAGVKIAPFKSTLRSLMPACYRNKKLRKSLVSIPIATGPGRSNGNPELVEPLQDLANIITYEIRLAYEDDYYPGVPDVDPMAEEHVDQIMMAMQREVDREQRYADGRTRWKTTVHLPDLPRERKTALAERRRHWFGVFGITPRSWKTGKWSLWKVANVPYPEGYKIPAW